MRVIIYQLSKNAMQSGKARVGQWRMQFEPQGEPFIEPLMGWTGTYDTAAQVDLRFDSKEDAIAYAKRKGYDITIREAKPHVVPPKSYADNFRFNKIKP